MNYGSTILIIIYNLTLYFLHLILGRSDKKQQSYTQKMKQKIDSKRGRLIYSKRIGTIEPVFANLRHAI